MHNHLHPTFGIVILVLNVNVLFLDVIVGVLKPVICMGNNCSFQILLAYKQCVRLPPVAKERNAPSMSSSDIFAGYLGEAKISQTD